MVSPLFLISKPFESIIVLFEKNLEFLLLNAVSCSLSKNTSEDSILNFFDLKVTLFFKRTLFSSIKFPSLALIEIFSLLLLIVNFGSIIS